MKKWLFIAVVCLVPAACGPGLIYPNLDWLIPMVVDDYISLDNRQADLFKARLSRQLKWHCRVQLPVYADLLEEMQQDFGDSSRPVTPDRLAEYLSRMKECWLELRAQLGPDIATILAATTDEQLRELYANLDKKNRKLERKYLEAPEEDVVRRRKKRMIKRLKYWLPDLTTAQEAAVDEWSAGLDPIEKDWLDNRKRVQAEFRRLLDQRDKRDRFTSDFTDLLMTFDQTRTPDYQAKLDANTARTLAFLARLNQMLTPDQRTHLLGRIETLARSFEQQSCNENG